VGAVLVDASAIVAFLDQNDANHERAAEAVQGVRSQLATVWAVVTEAMYLLAKISHNGRPLLCDMVSDGTLTLLELNPSEFPRLKELMAKYRDLPMDFADAALVRVAERDGLTRIITFDRDFHVYRLPRRGRFTVLP
jgi:predicted nucleic acid-binding protein